jgi:aminoglycoside phosphotransferase (APT) family kinase protein
MTTAASSRGAVVPFPVDRVAGWLREQGVSLLSPVVVELISGGRSNLTYSLIGADGSRVVLRRPPLDGILETAHDMSREWRFMRALRSTAVPVPDVLAIADTAEPLGVPFYVMSFVEGIVLHDAQAARGLRPAAQAKAASSLIDTMAALHAVDIDEVGLASIAKREDYVARQLRRWKRQWDQSKSGDMGAVDAAHAQLSRAIPPQTRNAIVHGDFRLGNMLCAPDGEISAVLDWELATLGDPLADLGWLLSSWLEAAEREVHSAEDAPPSILPGFPSRQWMIDRYRRRTGADLSEIEFFVAFAFWRSACIGAGVLARYEAGVMEDDGFSPTTLRQTIGHRAEAALQLLAGRA